MFIRCNSVFVLLICSHAAFAQQGETRDGLLSLRADLVKLIHQVDLSELSAGDTVLFCLDASHAFSEAEQKELAGHYFQQAIEAANASDASKYQYRLFEHAIKIHDLKSAADIAASSDPKNRFLNRLAVEKYRRGDDSALEGFPRGTMNFHLALDLSDAYWKREEFEKLELFVRGIDSLPSNEPTDVGAIIWRRIADDFRRRGDMAKAKEFIDKAKEIGGNNYYTGYGVRVAWLSIHGGLKEQAKKYAARAVAYRGHHTRELLSRLIGELVAAGHFDVAKEMLQYYPTDEERVSAERYFAYGLAKKRQFGEATKIAKAIKDVRMATSARILVAGQLLEAGKVPNGERVRSRGSGSTSQANRLVGGVLYPGHPAITCPNEPTRDSERDYRSCEVTARQRPPDGRSNRGNQPGNEVARSVTAMVATRVEAAGDATTG